MSFEIGTATSYTNLLDLLNAFLLKGHTLSPVFTGTGTGQITGLIGTSNSIQETITLTFTSPTAFTVAGSTTGAMGSGTVGTLFTHARVRFTVTAGGTAWAAADTISFVMTPPWTSMRSVAGSEMIWRAPGNDGLHQIFVGAKTFYNDPADYFNWRLQGFIGYSSGTAFDAQPGAIPDPVPPCLPLWNSPTPYWFFGSGQRVIVVAKISTVYEMAYLGFMDGMYMSPGEYPYPLIVGGSLAFYDPPAETSPLWRWSNTSLDQHANFWHSQFETATLFNPRSGKWRMRGVDGVWKGFSAYPQPYGGSRMPQIWPFTNGLGALRANLDGSYPMLPIVAFEANEVVDAYNVYGELGGIVQITGDGNASENLVIEGRHTWLVAQNSYRTASNMYCAIRMD